MPITSVEKDLDALTMTVTADFAAGRRRLWEAYTDPARSSASGDRSSGPPRSSGTTCSWVGARTTS